MRYLLDANVISELRLPSPNRGLAEWWAQVDHESLFLSVLTLGEIRRGIERVRPRDAAMAAELELFLEGLLHSFGSRLVPVDSDIALRWGHLRAAPRTPAIDTLLAATAIERGWTLVTRNVRDVEQTGCAVLNPFS